MESGPSDVLTSAAVTHGPVIPNSWSSSSSNSRDPPLVPHSATYSALLRRLGCHAAALGASCRTQLCTAQTRCWKVGPRRQALFLAAFQKLYLLRSRLVLEQDHPTTTASSWSTSRAARCAASAMFASRTDRTSLCSIG